MPNRKNNKDQRRLEKLERNRQRLMEEKRTNLKEFKTKNDAQQDYYEAIHENDLVFGLGPAGTGKTYVAVRAALEKLVANTVSRIYITRPIIEAGEEEIGILPGGIDEKLYPYFYPIQDSIGRLVKNPDRVLEHIEIAPLAFMRGRTFWNCVVILDEAQNTTPNQMRMFLSRLGENCTAIVNGDESQKDRKGKSGLDVACDVLDGLEGVEICEFEEEDIVRSGLVRRILQRWPNAE